MTSRRQSGFGMQGSPSKSGFIGHARHWLTPAVFATIAGTAIGIGATGCQRTGESPVVAAVSLPKNIPLKPGRPPALQPETTDAATALKQMVSAYKGLRSLYTKSEADLVYVVGQRTAVHQTTTITYTRDPVRISITIQDPSIGTEQYVADGHNLVSYRGINNLYRRRAIGSGIREMVTLIDRDAPQIMSPLVFLLSRSMPDGVESARVTGREILGGKRTVVIRGMYSLPYMRQIGSHWFSGYPSPTGREFTLWLEEGTFLLRKSSVRLGWAGLVALRDRPGVRAPNPQVNVVERVVESVPNPSLAADDFKFIAPQGAEETTGSRAPE